MQHFFLKATHGDASGQGFRQGYNNRDHVNAKNAKGDPASGPNRPPDQTNATADIHVSPDGRFLQLEMTMTEQAENIIWKGAEREFVCCVLVSYVYVICLCLMFVCNMCVLCL